MKSVIQKLYDVYMNKDNEADNEVISKIAGNLCKEKKEAAYQCYRELRAKLSGELDLLMDKQLEIYPQELEESFAIGFKTGARLMCEIYIDESKAIKTDV